MSYPGNAAVLLRPESRECATWRETSGSRNPYARLALKWRRGGLRMNGIIYLVGLIVIVMFILSLLGLR
ncbi:hypothetical protein CT676_06940 [Bradyrhizobium sp. MOS001]|nr:hypothetical protein CT676_06940 [Bradyrhizobium sp. MOS001]